MKRTARLAMICGALLLLFCAPQAWTTALDFESGVDWDPVGWAAPGVQFLTLSGDDLVYADIDAGWPFASDNGKQEAGWEFFISGNVAVASPFDNYAMVTFTDPISAFSVGYSSWFPFVAEAYDASGALVAQTGGAANSRYWNGTGLSYLSLSSPTAAIYSVKLYADQGSFDGPGWWVMDNVTFERPQSGTVPDWPTAALALLGLPVTVRAIRYRRSADGV